MSETNPSTAEAVDAQKTVTTATDQQGSERKYSGGDLEKIVKDRLAREQQKHSKALDALKAEYEQRAAKPPAANDDEIVKSKLAAYEAEKQSLQERLTRLQSDNLRAQLKASLTEQGCVDPDLISDLFVTKGLVRMEEDGKVGVDHYSGDVNTFVADYLQSKPHLLKDRRASGLGTQPPRQPTPGPVGTAADFSGYTTEQLYQLAGGKPQSPKLFGKKG